MPRRKRRPAEDEELPEWSNFGVKLWLDCGCTFGQLFFDEGPSLPSLAVMEALWELYRDRFADAEVRPWAALVFDDGLTPDEARATRGR